MIPFEDMTNSSTAPKTGGFNLTTLILGALVAGTIVGLLLNLTGLGPVTEAWLTNGIFRVGGQIFFTGLKLLVVPVVFVSLVCGVGAIEDIKKMGRIGSKALGLYVGTTALAVSIALVISTLTSPGEGFNLVSPAEYKAKEAPGLADVIIGMFPSNPFQAMAEANMIQIIVMAILFGVAASLAGTPGKRILGVFGDLNEVIMRVVMIVMWIAPIGVFCLLAEVFAKQGLAAIAPLSKYFFTVLAALMVHFFLVYTPLLKYVGRLSPLVFFKKFRKVMVFGFSTSSSNATLPINLEVTEKELGVSNSVASFTLPLGATVNMDGTAIMQGVATVFIAQAYGIDIGWGGYIAVIGTATLASIGTAGVPGVGLITLAMVLRQVNLPVEGIGLIIGVDRILDMSRTILNVTGDAVVTCVVAKSEGQLDENIFYSRDT